MTRLTFGLKWGDAVERWNSLGLCPATSFEGLAARVRQANAIVPRPRLWAPRKLLRETADRSCEGVVWDMVISSVSLLVSSILRCRNNETVTLVASQFCDIDSSKLKIVLATSVNAAVAERSSSGSCGFSPTFNNCFAVAGRFLKSILKRARSS